MSGLFFAQAHWKYLPGHGKCGTGGMVHLFRSFLGTDSIMVSIISMLLFGVLYLGIVCLSRENRDFLLAIFKKVKARVG